MEVHSHGIDTLGVNKEADKVYNPEVKDISSQIPAGENFTVLPSANTPDVHVNNDVAKNVDVDSNALPSAAFSFPPATSDLNSAPDINFQPFDSVGVGQDSEHEIHQVSVEDEAFDDMVILENDMVTAASLSGGPGDTTDTFQVTDIQLEGFHQAPMSDDYNAPSIAPDAAVVEVNVGEATEHPSNVQLAESTVTVVTDVTVVMEATQVIEPAVGLPSSEGDGIPAVPTSDSVGVKALDGTNVAETVNPTAAGVDTAQKNEEVTSVDIQAIKGQKVVKKFGRKSFGGEVVGFDPETKWFKVIYEDGDEEDLELSEVKEILESASKKRPRAGGDADASFHKSSKKPKKTGSQSTAKKPRSAAKSPKTPGTKVKVSKSAKKSSSSKKAKSPGKLIKKALDSSAFKTPSKSEVKEGKGKGKAGTLTPKSTKGRSTKRSKSPKVSRSLLSLQSPTFQKKGKDKASGERSTSKKVAKSSGVKRKADKGETSSAKSKRFKKAVTEGGDTDLVGKQVKKEFDGTFYDGVVVKFDKKTQFYKVKYSDGDQEDLELHELEPILVQEVQDLANTDAKDDKPAKLSSLSSLMSAEK